MRIQIEGKWRKYKNPEVLLQNNKDIYNWETHISLSHTHLAHPDSGERVARQLKLVITEI